MMEAEIRKSLPDSYSENQINANMAYWAENRDEIGNRWYAWQAE
jgi:putative spermidine/putrescine transport system substrate-binding protein